MSGASDGTPANAGAARGIIAVLAAGCLWGSVGVFVRVLTGFGYSPLTIVFARMSLAFVITAAALVITGKHRLLFIRLKDLWCFIGTGVSSAILLNLFFSLSTLMNPLSLAAILLATAPIFTVFLSAPIFGERVTAVKIQALVLCFTGCALTSGLTGGGPAFSLSGVLIGLLAGLGFALYSLTTRTALNRGYDSLTVNVYSFGIGALACVPFTNFGLIAATVSDAPGKMVLLLLLHTLCASLVPYILYTYGMKFLDTGKASILVSIEPVAATVFGLALYGEFPSAVSIAGIILVLLAISLLTLPGGLSAIPNVLRITFRRK